MLPILGYALFLAGGKYLQMVKLHQDLQVVRAELDAEKRLNIKLQEELAEARSDTHIEAVARRDLGLIKSGDHAIVLSSTGARPTPTPMPAVEPGRNDQSLPPFLSWLLDRLGQ
jgi:hypothetical protein